MYSMTNNHNGLQEFKGSRTTPGSLSSITVLINSGKYAYYYISLDNNTFNYK